MSKPAKTIQEQIELLESRNMAYRDIANAPHFLENISYYRLKGYWWEMQDDKKSKSKELIAFLIEYQTAWISEVVAGKIKVVD